MASNITIKPANIDEFNLIWPVFQAVVKSGDTYIYLPDMDYFHAEEIWMRDTHAYIIRQGEEVIGTYVIRPNKIGRGAHVCNAGFMVHPDYQNQGIGRKMGDHALKQAKTLGYQAMQFNVVVSTNARSIALWTSLGFTIVGTIPQGFDHKNKGLVDLYIMHKFLD